MDREQFRQRVTQVYVTGKGIGGAGLDEIAKGNVDPVEQMKYLSEMSRTPDKTKSTTSTAGSGTGFLIVLIILALATLALFLPH